MGVWYRTGTVAVTNGSPDVVGVGTLWLTQASAGDIFLGPNLVEHEITSITDDTHLALRQVNGTAAYAGTTASAQLYAIIRNFTSTMPAQLASQLAAMMTAWHVTTDELTAWLSGTGSTTVHDAVGNAYNVQTPTALNAAWNGRLVKNVAGGVDVTLTSAEASNLFIELTGTLTANINVIMPAGVRHNFVFNNTAGAFVPTAKTAAGTGVAVAQGVRALLECDGTNVLNAVTALLTGYTSGAGTVSATDTVLQAVQKLDGNVAGKAALAGSASQAFSTAALTVTGNAAIGDASTDIHTVNGTMVFNHGFTFGNLTIVANDIGVAGTAGFGVGICPSPPSGMYPLSNGAFTPSDADYGNYQYSDGSVMVWIPAFYYKYGTGANGLAVNMVDIKPFSAYVNVAAANAAGYALHRMFYDGGTVQAGVFVDKYKCSNNGGVASSIRYGNPLSSAATNNPFSGLTGAPANFYYGAIAAAKTRGANFFPSSIFIHCGLALISLAHAQASTSAVWCAWYDGAGVTNFPKGCNNNALGDMQDTALAFTATGNATYTTANKTGSANVLAKTTHNGQNCGVADVSGTIFEICLGLTSNGTNIYVLKTGAVMKDITSGNTLATDAWGATGIAALYDDLGTTYGALWATGVNRTTYFGSAGQVFSDANSGNAWNAAGAGVPLSGGVGGTNTFGNDGLYDYKPTEMCPLVSGTWDASATTGGIWMLNLGTARGASGYYAGLRSALYI